MYKLNLDGSVSRQNDNGSITSFTSKNSEWNEYQEWLDKGNTPEPADAPPEPTYAELRAKEYPSIPDQLDLIYNKGIAGWKTEIKKTKDKYPKP